MKTRKARPDAPSNAPDTPFLAARRTWNDHVGSVVAARNLWQLAALVSLFVAAAAVGALAHVATRSKFIPYVVEVDEAGHVEAIKRAVAMAPATRAVIESQLEKFITLSRRVTTDIALQRAAVKGTFALLALKDPATTKMKAHLTAKHPVKRAATETVTTEITSILPQSGQTWQVDWTERTYDREGNLMSDVPMRALVEVYQGQPVAASEEVLRANPLAIFVRDYHWGPREQREVTQ